MSEYFSNFPKIRYDIYGTNSTAPEYSTAVNLDPSSETGAVFTVPFKVVQPTSSGAASGTAFSFVYADSTQASDW